MRETHKTLAFFLLLFAAVSVDLSHGSCSQHGKHGVDCSTVEDVKDLKSIREIQSLKVHPMIKEIPKGTFKSFKNLTHLDLSGGALKRIEPGGFSHLDRLLSLNLADNQIKNFKAGTFKGLDQLSSLNLRKNGIRRLSPELLNLKSLQVIDLVGNPLQCNCASLTVRDALLEKNVKISKKTLCSGPAGLKGMSFLKPETHVICLLDEKSMQMDEPMMNDEEGSGTDYDENYDDKLSEELNSVKVEDPKVVKEVSNISTKGNSTAEDIFFDAEENEKKVKKPENEIEEGSGTSDDEGSGLEGPMVEPIDWGKIQEETEQELKSSNDSTSTTASEGILDIIFGSFWTTTTQAPVVKKISKELEDEQFIHVTTSSPDEDLKNEDNSDVTTVLPVHREFKPGKESEKMRNPAEDQSERLNESLSHQSKKGMGSYVVLGILLVVLAGLIVFAAYKGDFCRSKRKQNNVEDGTELKDMQKSLLNHNNTSPKIGSNGNLEIAPLMNGKDEDGKLHENGNHKNEDRNRMEPTRKSMNLEEQTLINGHDHCDTLNIPNNYKPPISPGAQRVKITLQENPDSVPKTPILINRIQQIDSLVKAP